MQKQTKPKILQNLYRTQHITLNMQKKIDALTFEDALERLETILESMESGDTALAELIERFEESSILLKTCQKKLKEAELRIEKLNLETGKVESFEDHINED